MSPVQSSPVIRHSSSQKEGKVPEPSPAMVGVGPICFLFFYAGTAIGGRGELSSLPPVRSCCWGVWCLCFCVVGHNTANHSPIPGRRML
jgi:hypothetical protein